MRAKLSKGTLRELGLDDIPVAAGSMMLKEGGSKLATEYEFDVGYLADEEDLEPVEGVEFMAELLRQGADESITLVLLSGLTDAFLLLDEHRNLFKQKVK